MIEGVFIDGRKILEAIDVPDDYPELRRGSRGSAVSILQRILKERNGEDELEIDGTFGPAPEAALKRFQEKNFSTPDGIVTPTMWVLLAKIAGKTTEGAIDDIGPLISRMSVSLTMDAVSQITIEVPDPGLRYLAANYFQVRRKVRYLGLVFEIASVEVSSGNAGEFVKIECRSRATQRMKRKKGKNLFNGGSSTAYAATKARDFGLSYFGEKTAKKNNISQSQNGTTDESVWSVLQRLAGENQFKLFETDGTLFFASQQFLLGKFALVGTDGDDPNFLSTPIRWLNTSDDATYERYARIVGPKGNPVLKLGSTGAHVKFVHDILKKRTTDYASAANEVKGTSKNTTIGGVTRTTTSNVAYFGPKTEAAIKKIQATNNLPATGVVDDATWGVLRAYAAEKSQYRGNFYIRPMSCPTIRRSDDDYFAATCQFEVEHAVGTKLRPGMTIYFEDIPNFRTNFLISEVAWEEGTDSPVTVSGLTPQYPEATTDTTGNTITRQDLASRVDLSGGGFANLDYNAALIQTEEA